MGGARILLIVGGGVAAYKSLELVRRLADRGIATSCVMTRAAQEFVTPLAFASLTGETVHTELFELTAEVEMGHIELSRSADLIVVAPATADLMAKMAHGLANDLASTVLLATDAPVLIAPAMNVRMWLHPATQRNLAALKGDGVAVIGPNEGGMACGEYGPGRMAEPMEMVAAIEEALSRAGPKPSLAPPASMTTPNPMSKPMSTSKPLAGLRALVTSGPTHEPIDPVRYIANRSSGRQGAAIGAALAAAGADVAFVTGPAEAPPPAGCRIIPVETARDMRDAALSALPVDVAVFAAAVADWRVRDAASSKIKKQAGASDPPTLTMVENPDILAEVSHLDAPRRPSLVIGFAAETDAVLENARAKRLRKGCDWLIANDVSPESGVMGGVENEATLITAEGERPWPRLDKTDVAARLIAEIVAWAEATSATRAGGSPA